MLPLPDEDEFDVDPAIAQLWYTLGTTYALNEVDPHTHVPKEYVQPGTQDDNIYHASLV
jgi:hypothetical protein